MTRRAVAVLALVATACSPGVRRAEPTPTATSAPARGYLVYATDREVRAIQADGGERRIANVREVAGLAVSADGRHVAILSGIDRLAVTVHDVDTGRTSTWTAPSDDFSAQDIGRSGDHFVVVANDTLLRFDPAAADPESVPLTGVEDARLLAANDARILVGVSEPDFASARGGPETVYSVAADGRATRLFHDTEGEEEGTVRNLRIGAAALTADGRRLVYGSGVGGIGPDECDLAFVLIVRDLVANREVPTDAPSLPGDVLTVYGSVTTGPDGRTVVGLTTQLGGCGQAPAGAAYVLDGAAWQRVAPGAVWAATSRDGRLATISARGNLSVGGRRVAAGVELAAWAPV